MFQFPKTNRILKRKDFQTSMDCGEKVVDSLVVALGRKTSLGTPRIGIIVSKKIGNSVVRNKVKRQIREGFRFLKSELSDIDVVIIARQKAAEAHTKELITSFSRCLGRLNRKFNV